MGDSTVKPDSGNDLVLSNHGGGGKIEINNDDTIAVTGTVSGITSTEVGLGNVTNESKATMFTSPTFTGNVALGSNATGTFKGTIDSTATFPDGVAIEIQNNFSTSAGCNGVSSSTHEGPTFISTNVVSGYKYLVMCSGGYGGYFSSHSAVAAYYGIRMDGASNTDQFNTLLTSPHGQNSPPSVQMVFEPSTTETVEWKFIITGTGSSTIYWQASSNYPIYMTVVTFKH